MYKNDKSCLAPFHDKDTIREVVDACDMATRQGRMAHYFDFCRKFSQKGNSAVTFMQNDFLVSNEHYGSLLELLSMQPRERKGGVFCGVSFEQNMSMILAQEAELGVIADFNKGVTEIMLPVVLELLCSCQSRLEFLAILFGKDYEAGVVQQSKEEKWSLEKILLYLKTRNRNTYQIIDDILSIMPSDVKPHAEAFWKNTSSGQSGQLSRCFDLNRYIEFCQQQMKQEQLTLHWLGTEDNFKKIKIYAETGKIKGISGDFLDPNGIAQSVIQISASTRIAIKLLYTSNVITWGYDSRALSAIIAKADPMVAYWRHHGPLLQTSTSQAIELFRIYEAILNFSAEKSFAQQRLINCSLLLLSSNQCAQRRVDQKSPYKSDVTTTEKYSPLKIGDDLMQTSSEFRTWLAVWTEKMFETQAELPNREFRDDIMQFIRDLRDIKSVNETDPLSSQLKSSV